MSSLDIYTDILCKWKDVLDGDPRIGGQRIGVQYTRIEPTDIDLNLMPYIALFLQRGWEDDAYGSGSYSPQSRRVKVRIGMILAMLDRDEGRLDEKLFAVGGELLDLIRERQLFDVQKQIIVCGPISWDFETIGTENHGIIGTQSISFQMEQFVNFG